ncbi:MAG: hypothetical protein LBU51_08120 [Bacteroidales bacterium]|jgi:hypothetical protein|nr:hypothetical protein [Bacteroidales bacterium]
MKKTLFAFFFGVFLVLVTSGQDTLSSKIDHINEQESEQAKFKQNKFSVFIDLPGIDFLSGYDNLKTTKSNVLRIVAAGFDYNFSEIVNLGFRVSYYHDHTLYLHANDEEYEHQAL